MKLQCILMSLAFVKVLAMITADYKKSIHITNLLFKEAFTTNENELLIIVKNLVIEDIPMEQISMLLAVPELAHSSTTRECVEKNQDSFRKKIIKATKLSMPKVPSTDGDHEDDGDPSVYDFGKDRRAITQNVTKAALLLATLKREELAFDDLAYICRLMGLFRNTIFSRSFTKTAIVDGFGTCTVEDSQNGVSQIKFDETDKLEELLKIQIKNWEEEEKMKKMDEEEQ